MTGGAWPYLSVKAESTLFAVLVSGGVAVVWESTLTGVLAERWWAV